MPRSKSRREGQNLLGSFSEPACSWQLANYHRFQWGMLMRLQRFGFCQTLFYFCLHWNATVGNLFYSKCLLKYSDNEDFSFIFLCADAVICAFYNHTHMYTQSNNSERDLETRGRHDVPWKYTTQNNTHGLQNTPTCPGKRKTLK